jgi:hypothetical protein
MNIVRRNWAEGTSCQSLCGLQRFFLVFLCCPPAFPQVCVLFLILPLVLFFNCLFAKLSNYPIPLAPLRPLFLCVEGLAFGVNLPEAFLRATSVSPCLRGDIPVFALAEGGAR